MTANVMCNGKSFHLLSPATGNARSPTVESRTGGTSRRREAEDRNRRLDVMSVTQSLELSFRRLFAPGNESSPPSDT